MKFSKDTIYLNCNVGCNSLANFDAELAKIKAIKESGFLPDMMMDLSLYKSPRPLYKYIQEIINIPVGTVLSYIPFSKSKGLVWDECKEYLEHLGRDGVSFVTIHFTANLELLQFAKSRSYPTTSRGGGICLYDIQLNRRSVNLFMEHIDEIIEIALKYDLTISLGTTFRPGNIFDACDVAHIEETRQQLETCRYLQEQGVKVIVENVGHISLDKMEEHAKILQEFNAPIMPLGPIITDTSIGQDHISAALGAAFSIYWGAANIINCVTRNEHLTAEITAEDMIEAIRTMRVVQQSINIAKGQPKAIALEHEINKKRTEMHSCMISGVDCIRCMDVCPLRLL